MLQVKEPSKTTPSNFFSTEECFDLIFQHKYLLVDLKEEKLSVELKKFFQELNEILVQADKNDASKSTILKINGIDDTFSVSISPYDI